MKDSFAAVERYNFDISLRKGSINFFSSHMQAKAFQLRFGPGISGAKALAAWSLDLGKLHAALAPLAKTPPKLAPTNTCSTPPL